MQVFSFILIDILKISSWTKAGKEANPHPFSHADETCKTWKEDAATCPGSCRFSVVEFGRSLQRLQGSSRFDSAAAGNSINVQTVLSLVRCSELFFCIPCLKLFMSIPHPNPLRCRSHMHCFKNSLIIFDQ